MPDKMPTVALVVPVFNDFMEKEILFSFNQTYKFCTKYILDDSTDTNTIKQIDDFAKQHNVTVLRRNSYKKDLYGKNGLANAFDYFISTTKDK
jgi:hypothetical protein